MYVGSCYGRVVVVVVFVCDCCDGVCVHVCVCVCKCVCMYVCMVVGCVFWHGGCGCGDCYVVGGGMCACLSLCMHVCMYVCMYV